VLFGKRRQFSCRSRHGQLMLRFRAWRSLQTTSALAFFRPSAAKCQ
jgi:hypothetical protein